VGQAGGVSKVHRELARAKLTRSFRVTGRRDDGYHEVRAEMVTLGLADDVELSSGDGIEIVDQIDWSRRTDSLGSLVGDLVVDNLVTTALSLAGRRAHVRLVKRIPPGAGLGGGSADAAAVLRWAGVSDLHLAAKIGSDVPFCLVGGRANVEGAGEVVEPLAPVDLSFVLLTPAVSVSTSAVYAAFDEIGPSKADSSSNDLEQAALVVEPRLGRFRELLGTVSGLHPKLAGSGATWFVECDPTQSEEIAQAVLGAVMEADLTALVVATDTAG